MNINQVRGAIFDIDDTLLDNKPGVLGRGLHERSRLAAFRAVGEKYGIAQLSAITLEQNLDAFLSAPVHSLPGAVWNYLWKSGLVDSEVINPEHRLFCEIVAMKNELHADILRNEGEEVPGSTEFVRLLARNGLMGKLAIASSAIRRDIDIYLQKVGLTELFPDHRIMSLESAIHTKPHPELFNRAFQSLELSEQDRPYVLAFEDDPRGIMSAKAAGLYVCAITTRYTAAELCSLEVVPDVVAAHYDEFSQSLDMGLARHLIRRKMNGEHRALEEGR